MGLVTSNLAADAKLQLLGLIIEDKLAERTYSPEPLSSTPPKQYVMQFPRFLKC